MIDPPPGAAELSFLRFSQAYINRFLFVMNDKHDLSQQSPAEAAAVIAYARRELATAGIESPPVIAMNPGAYLRGADGGFGTFLPLLADFLIEGRGRALLSDAIRKADQHIHVLDSALLRQMANIDRQTADLQTVLLTMNNQRAALETRQLALLARVDSELCDIVAQLVADIDQLSERIDRAAADAIDKAGLGTLRVIHLYLPETIQQTVSGWLRDKSAWINARCTALYQRVVADLRELVNDYQAADLAAVSIQPAELPREIDIALGGDVALALATGLGIAAGVALLDVITTGGIGAVSLVVGGAAGSGTAGAMLLQRVRTSLKAALHQPLPAPNGGRTTLSALIDGYIHDGGQPIPGLRERLTAEFDGLSDTIKRQINATVAEAWQPRFDEIQAELNRRMTAATDISGRRLALDDSRRQLTAIGQSCRTIAEALDTL